MITTITMSLRLPLIAAYFQFDYDVLSPTVARQPDKQGTYRHLLIRFHKGRSNPSRGCNQFRNSQQLLKWTNEKTNDKKRLTTNLRECWGLKLLSPAHEMSPLRFCYPVYRIPLDRVSYDTAVGPLTGVVRGWCGVVTRRTRKDGTGVVP